MRVPRGLSPLARGNHPAIMMMLALAGPIPARAGQPALLQPRAASLGAYPRSRGATRLSTLVLVSRSGLSPLARGNRREPRAQRLHAGPIPARAGQPQPKLHAPRLLGAYPRSRGATYIALCPLAPRVGLSPLARGNQIVNLPRRAYLRPIPARAGQPPLAMPQPALHRAYPRSRGATAGVCGAAQVCGGLSPLARGNHQDRRLRLRRIGPIPARAGQPQHRFPAGVVQGAYPRSRGATTQKAATTERPMGLSPLARGNPGQKRKRIKQMGPIPARAGQPSARHTRTDLFWAYPRSRGATNLQDGGAMCVWGLSPLARGNLNELAYGCACPGPIPARAGQPSCDVGKAEQDGAYPRSRGATVFFAPRVSHPPGLSPLARGNRWLTLSPASSQGPIPARAGQPFPVNSDSAPWWAYPRSRGATSPTSSKVLAEVGLSPLARGNLLQLTRCSTRENRQIDVWILKGFSGVR